MNVVGHKAISINLTREFFFQFSQVSEVVKVIIVAAKYVLSIMTPLNYMVRAIGYYDSSLTWHSYIWLSKGDRPIFPMGYTAVLEIWQEDE